MQVKEITNQEYEMLCNSLAGRRKTKLQTTIEKFMCSDADVIEVVPEKGAYKDTKSLVSALYVACRRSSYRIRAVMIGGRVFIRKLGVDE